MTGDGTSASAGEVLRRCLMPPREIGSVLTADDPAVVHMLIELHVERLREELVDRLTSLSEVEASITSARFGASPPRRLDQLRHLRPSA
jgi:hypothetical protein